MSEALTVKLRESTGKRNARRMRLSGSIPAVLYGHGEQTKSLSVPAEQLAAALRHGARLIELQGDVSEKAFIRQLQWDTYGAHVLHLDLTRVSEHEKIQMKVPVELRGEAPGVKNGGVIEHLLHEVEIECAASAIPEKLQVRINDLQLDGQITVGEIQLPSGVEVLAEADAVVVQCVMPKVEQEPGEGDLGGGVEPEIIGRKASEDEGEES
jgi:large subunit ribosomal protein L25